MKPSKPTGTITRSRSSAAVPPPPPTPVATARGSTSALALAVAQLVLLLAFANMASVTAQARNVQPATIHEAMNGTLFISASAGRPVMINGVDVLKKIEELEALVDADVHPPPTSSPSPMASPSNPQAPSTAPTDEPTPTSSPTISPTSAPSSSPTSAPTALFTGDSRCQHLTQSSPCDPHVGNLTKDSAALLTADDIFSVAAGDLNTDGLVDIAVSMVLTPPSTFAIGWFANVGGNTFSATPATITTIANFRPYIVQLADLNGDTFLDVVYAVLPTRVGWNAGDGTGNFGADHDVYNPGGFPGPNYILGYDVDGDKDVDIVSVSTVAQEVLLHRNDGLGSFTTSTMVSSLGGSVSTVSACDVGNDGDWDFVTVSESRGEVILLTNNGTGSFSSTVMLLGLSSPKWVECADFTGDGLADVVVSETDTDVFLITGTASGGAAGGAAAAAQVNNTVRGLTQFRSADLDQDGDLDIIGVSTTTDSTVAAFINEGGVFTQNVLDAQLDTPSTLTLFDIDLDGDVDLLVPSRTNDVLSLFRNGEVGVEGGVCEAGFCVARSNSANGVVLRFETPFRFTTSTTAVFVTESNQSLASCTAFCLAASKTFCKGYYAVAETGGGLYNCSYLTNLGNVYVGEADTAASSLSFELF